MYTLLNNLGVFGNDYYWSSSEESSDPWFAWEQDFSNGDQKKANRGSDYRVRPVRAYL